MKDQDPDDQLQEYDKLFEDGVLTHGRWVKNHLILEELVDFDLLPNLDKLSGIAWCKHELEDTIICFFRGLQITTDTMAKIRRLSLEHRVSLTNEVQTTSDEVRAEPDLEIGYLIQDIWMKASRTILPPMEVYLDIVKKNFTGPCAELQQQDNGDRFIFIAPPFTGHTVGRVQAKVASALPKALMSRVVHECLTGDLNIDDWLLDTGAMLVHECLMNYANIDEWLTTTGTFLKQQQATMQLDAQLRAAPSVIKECGPGKDSLPPPIGIGPNWECEYCSYPSTCEACRSRGIPTSPKLVYRGATWDRRNGCWHVDGVSATKAGMMDSYGVDVSALAEVPPQPSTPISSNSKDACDFPDNKVRRGVTLAGGVFREDIKEPPTLAFSPLLIMLQDGIDAVAKKIEGLSPGQSAATHGADNTATKGGGKKERHK
jgi:hypothetical protein